MTTATREPEVLSREEKYGHIVYLLVNDRGQHRCVTIRPDGTVSCLHEDGRCKGTWNGGYCYHILYCLDIEAHPYVRVEIDEEATTQQYVDEEYEQWKRDNNLTAPLSREQYIAEFNPDGL